MKKDFRIVVSVAANIDDLFPACLTFAVKNFKVQLATPIRLTCSYDGVERTTEIPKNEIVVGRPAENAQPDVDLSPDTNVSRRHARIWIDDGAYWIEDLGSKFGTQVDGQEINELGKWRLPVGVPVRVGDSTLRVEAPTVVTESFVPLLAEAPVSKSALKIGTMLDVNARPFNLAKTASAEVMERQALLLELPLEFAAQTRLDALLQTVMQRVVDVIPGAERGALLLRSRSDDALLLAAYVSATEPPVSETLARRAMSLGKGFLWRRSVEGDVAPSVKRLEIESGMYAPLIWKGKPLGVICVDNPQRDSAFTDDDLRLLVAIAHFAAMSVANHQLQDDLRSNARLLERLLANFSPKIRETLLQKARHGKLRPGGEKSEVTVLFSDIRGFTATSAEMDASDVVDLLNDYFPALTEIIFKFDGTIDKFVGDAILAVFGSPEADAHQHEKAVRAALAMQAAMKQVNARRAARGDVVCEIGIGVHCGEVLHGFIGSTERLEFTVIGDAVNRTSRYCDGARGGEVLISPEVYQRVFKLVQAEKTQIATKHEGELTAYRIRAMKE